jgi:hypothetical protein
MRPAWRRTLLGLLSLILIAGCASSESLPGASPTNYGAHNTGAFDVAVYRYPQTGDIRRCENTMGLFWWSGATNYGACKSKLEEQGYVRDERKP